MTKFYNNGPHIGVRENDDGTWDMSAAARMETKPNRVRDAYLYSSRQEEDDVKHTEEYYDKNRNRAPDNEVWGGLSNRSMKQKHGQAVQTTSEMMQDELEPLPINTFK